MFVKINQLLYIFIMLLFLRKEMYNTKIIVAFYNQSNWEAAAVYPGLPQQLNYLLCSLLSEILEQTITLCRLIANI